MGVIWARLNDSGGRNWQHGVSALVLLETLLKRGSPRLAILALSWLPLLRHLILPSVHSAALAGDWIVEGSGECHLCL